VLKWKQPEKYGECRLFEYVGGSDENKSYGMKKPVREWIWSALQHQMEKWRMKLSALRKGLTMNFESWDWRILCKSVNERIEEKTLFVWSERCSMMRSRDCEFKFGDSCRGWGSAWVDGKRAKGVRGQISFVLQVKSRVKNLTVLFTIYKCDKEPPHERLKTNREGEKYTDVSIICV